ncbi:MAG TPA: MerR family transcriptional regulator [Solirubrobacteraceae bacterium]|nr:MerR family transcriptional regulator [Solirubrobacteraceae bacterium]
MRTVGEVAELAGVTVRLLHHYDEIGVLSPSGRSEAAYRLYSFADLERLQEILIWRALGFPLAEIKALLDDGAYDRAQALRRQRALVESERGRLSAVARALDQALAALQNGTKVEEASMFDGFDNSQYQDEVLNRWGDTEAYGESARRAAQYTDADWAQISREAEQNVRSFVALLEAGEPADGLAARKLAEQHREHISRWFYECSPEFHRQLAEMYVADPRFEANYERRAPGLARHVHDAIVAQASIGT